MPVVEYKGQVVDFPDTMSQDAMRAALKKLDPPAGMPAPISTSTPVGEPSQAALDELGEPFHPSEGAMNRAERNLERSLSPGVNASSLGQTDPAKAAEALNTARVGVNLSPQAAALDADTLRVDAKHVAVVDALTASPSLNKYASQSEIHTDAVAPDATNLAAVGRGFFGEAPESMGSDFRQRQGDSSALDAIAQTLMKHSAGALASFVDAALGLSEMGVFPKPLTGTKELSQSLHQGAEVDLSKDIAGPVESVVGVAPSLAVYAAGGAAGKTALFGTAFTQNYGDLKHAGVDDGLAVTGALIAASIFVVPGGKFVGGLLGVTAENETREAGVQAMLELAKSPAVKQGLLTWGKHAVYGWLMTVGTAISNLAVRQTDDWVKTGREQDPSALWHEAWEATKQAGALVPFAGVSALRQHMELAPLREMLEQRGREVAAHADQIKLAQLVGPLQETKLLKTAPEEVKKIVKTMADDAGERWANEYQPPPGSKERAEAKPAPGTQAHVDADALRRGSEKLGLDPDKVAEHVTGNPDALREAEATGNPVSMPIENYAVDLSQMDLKKGTSLDPDNPSLARAERERKLIENVNAGSPLSPLLTEWNEVGKEPPSPERSAKLKEIEDRMRAATSGLPAPSKETRGKGIGIGEEPSGGAGTPPSKPPGGAPPAPSGGEEPSPKARKAQAEAAMAGKTLDELNTDAYRRGAQAAQREIDRLRVQVENKLSSAEQTAQQGIDVSLPHKRGGSQAARDKSVEATGKTVVAGEKSAEAARHEGIRDTNNAMEAARVRALKEANKIRADVDKLTTSPTRERMYRAGEIYGQLYDHLMQQMGLRKPVPNAVLEDPVNLMELLQASYGSDMPFEKDHVLDVIDKGRELGSLKLDGARNVRDFLSTLNTMARESSKAYIQGKLVERADAIIDIERNLRAQNPDAEKVLNPKQAEPPGFFKRQYEKVTRLFGDAAKNNFQTLLHPLGEWGDSHFLRTLDAEKSRAVIDNMIHDALLPTSKLPNLSERVPWPAGMKVPGLTETISRADMLHLRRLTGTMENARDIADATGVPVAAWEAWFDQHMTKEDYEATQRAWDGLKELGERTAAVHANRGGVPMVLQTPREITTQFGKYRAGYGGGMRWLENPNELPRVISPEDPMLGNRVASDTRHGLTNTRTPQRYFPDFSAVNDRAHFNEQAHDIAFSEVVRDGHRMINDPAFESAVTTYMGKEWYSRLVEAHNLMASGGRVDIDRGIGTVNALYVLGRVTAGATFPTNINTMVKMAMHPLQDAFIQGGSSKLLQAVFRAATPEGRLEANQNSRIVGLYTNEGYKRLMQMQRDLEGRVSGIGTKIGDVATMAGTWMQSQIMAMQAHIVWQTHKLEALADKASMQEAWDHADKRTAAAMPANTVFRQSSQNRNAVFATQNLVYNFEGAFWNMKQQQEIERRAGVELDGRSKVGSYALRTISRLAGYTALGLGLWVGGQGRNPEEEKADAQGTGPLGHFTGTAQAVARTLLIEGAFGSPVKHKVMEVVAPLMVGEKPGRHFGVFSPPADELFNSTWDDFTKVVNDQRSTPDRVESAFKMIARFIPGSVQLSRTGRGAYRLLTAQDFDPDFQPRGAFDVFDTLMRGPHPRNTSLLSDVQGAVSGLPRR